VMFLIYIFTILFFFFFFSSRRRHTRSKRDWSSDVCSSDLIKVSRFLKSIDQKVIDYANSIEFPLIEIPEAWNLGDITHHISDDESEKMNYSLNIQQELNHMLIKGYDANLMVERFSKLLKVPIMLINPFDDVEAVSHHYTHNRQLLNENLKYFKLYKSTQDIKQNTKSSFNEK